MFDIRKRYVNKGVSLVLNCCEMKRCGEGKGRRVEILCRSMKERDGLVNEMKGKVIGWRVVKR